jgi:transposase
LREKKTRKNWQLSRGELDMEVAKRLDPFQQDIERLDTIPGIGRRTAEQILAEVGTDVASS